MMRHARPLPFVAISLAALLHSAALAQVQTASTDELRKEGTAQALAGDFSRAATTFSRVVALDPNDHSSQDALTWARSATNMSAEREGLRRKMFDAYIDAAQKYRDKEKWTKAIDCVRIARLNTLNADDVLRLPWLGDLVAKTKKKIAEHREKGEWLDALVLYEVLGQVYEDRPEADEYEKEAKFCSKRAHFKVTYNKENAWKTRMSDIRREMVPEIFEKISKEYVGKPNFKEMIVAGLEFLDLLGHMKELNNTFSSLGDEDRAGDFTTRIKAELDRVNAEKELSWRDAVDRFGRILEINRSSVRLPEEVIVHEFLDGALSPLDDFTSVIWPADVPEFRKHTQGEFAGVGIQITKQEGEDGGYIRVETPLDDTPAYRAGISPGDLIIAVEGKSTKDMQVNDAVRIITGPIGSPVKLTIKRPPNEGSTDITLKREVIKIVSVKGYSRNPEGSGWDYLIDPKYDIGYIRVSQFTENTAEELRNSLRELRKQGGKGLILDLRFNPGGLLTSAIDVSCLFLDEKQGIVKTEGRVPSASRSPVTAPSDGRFSDVPIIVLVNEQSASASEIVAGALAGNNKALIVGERSFGKGSVQNLYGLGDNKALFKVTTAKYFVPTDPRSENWRCVHKEPKAKVWGVEPNILVKLFPAETVKVWELRRKQDTLKGRGQKELPKELFERKKAPSTQPDEDIVIDIKAPDVDPQLETALSVMRMKIMSKQDWVFAPRPVPAARPSNGG